MENLNDAIPQISSYYIVIANEDKTLFLSETPSYGWTNDLSGAVRFLLEDEAWKYIHKPEVDHITRSESTCLVWSDTLRSIHKNREKLRKYESQNRICQGMPEPIIGHKCSPGFRGICISTKDKQRFATTFPVVCWTENIYHAAIFDSAQEACDFETRHDAILITEGTETRYIWTDTTESIFDDFNSLNKYEAEQAGL